MADTSDLQAALVSLLGEETGSLPLQELLARARTRIAELEPLLNGEEGFGMLELEHGMLCKLVNGLSSQAGLSPGAPLH
jgi:hypothetical protein